MRSRLIPVAALSFALGLAACASAPPADPEPPEASVDLVAEEDIILELDSEMDSTPPSDPPPPPAPAEPVAEPARCAPEASVLPLATWADAWVREMAPLLGCPEPSLSRPEWNIVTRPVGESVREEGPDGAVRVSIESPDGDERAVVTLREGVVTRVSHTQRLPDAQRVVSLFRLNLGLLDASVGPTPEVSTDHQRLYRPTPQRPFGIHYFRTDSTIVMEVLDPDAALTVEPMPAPEAGIRAASGADCTDAVGPRLLEWRIIAISSYADRLGCDFDAALADLALTDPIETLTNPDGSVLVQTFVRPGPALIERLDQHVLVQHKQGKLASLGFLWRGDQETAWRQATTVGQGVYGEPDLSIPGQMNWFDDDELPYGVSIMRTEQGVLFQLIDARWF